MLHCCSDGIDEGMQWLVESIQRNVEVRPPKNAEDDWICDKLIYTNIIKLLNIYILLLICTTFKNLSRIYIHYINITQNKYVF